METYTLNSCRPTGRQDMTEMVFCSYADYTHNQRIKDKQTKHQSDSSSIR